MAQNLPYVTVVGTLEKMLEKITTASVPERFTQDFVNTKLAMKGGTARATIRSLRSSGLSPETALRRPCISSFETPRSPKGQWPRQCESRTRHYSR